MKPYKQFLTSIVVLIISTNVSAQNTFSKESQSQRADPNELNINDNVKGTLWIPENIVKPPLVIMLTGSGPNDRNGNSMGTNNDSHKQLAKALLGKGIATYRYDKRTFTQIKNRKVDNDARFDDFVVDLKAVMTHFKDDNRFSKIILAGHSQGSLVAMLAIDDSIDGFISLAGPADTIDQTIVEQIKAQSPGLDLIASGIFEKMKSQDGLVEDVPNYLNSILGTSIQPFMKSWMQYNPTDEIKKIKVPILIVNGTKDRQVSLSDADKLKQAKPNATLITIDHMDHLFKQVGDDEIVAAKSYIDPTIPLHPELILVLEKFIKAL